ncbi:MAG: pyridoxamine 5-phosphate oxidase [Deltaproteobacteria bacterium]|nr:MAG: pyridoxamine 5-phosphate oxidase [Deltaproteobacteria bacterium]
MPQLPEETSKAWGIHNGPVVLSTVNKNGIPNSIYATCVSKYDEETLVVANNYFSKTMENIKSGSKASILFITPENISYQVKGTIVYYTEGPVFDDMKKWNPQKHPGHGAAALKVEEVYKGGEKLL